MKEQVLIIDITGYWRDSQRAHILALPGIYFVFEASYDSVAGTLNLFRLLFVGHADNIREELKLRDRHAQWTSAISPGHELCYAAGLTETYYRSLAAECYIHYMKTPLNQPNHHHQLPGNIRIISTGQVSLIPTCFVIRTDPADYMMRKHRLHLRNSA